ncbi:hypothetical protein NXX91_19490 [Bacteroides thetaiotaomicron]|nr:hypothetical protein [Bacteroides thetaiotaomicron]MCS2901764.1 hypothetical protein [Bacteroides thetaiotaomicron]
MYILAHDLGTSGNKATLFDESGLLIASRTAAYPTDYASRQPGGTESAPLVESHR